LPAINLALKNGLKNIAKKETHFISYDKKIHFFPHWYACVQVKEYNMIIMPRS
jgi:hypothetical protein